MNCTEARDAILGAINTAIGSDTTVQIVWPDSSADPDVSKVRVEISFDGYGGDHTLGDEGNRFFQRDEALVVMCKSPIDTDSGKAQSLALTVRDLFEGKHLQSVWFRDCTIRPFGRVDTDIVYGLRCRYSYQEQK